MTVLRLLCVVGVHPRAGYQFVGSSWQPDDWVRVCRECGQELRWRTPRPKRR